MCTVVGAAENLKLGSRRLFCLAPRDGRQNHDLLARVSSYTSAVGTQNVRKRKLVDARAHKRVSPIESSRAQLYKHLTGARRWVGMLPDLDDLGATVLDECDCLHSDESTEMIRHVDPCVKALQARAGRPTRKGQGRAV